MLILGHRGLAIIQLSTFYDRKFPPRRSPFCGTRKLYCLFLVSTWSLLKIHIFKKLWQKNPIFKIMTKDHSFSKLWQKFPILKIMKKITILEVMSKDPLFKIMTKNPKEPQMTKGSYLLPRIFSYQAMRSHFIFYSYSTCWLVCVHVLTKKVLHMKKPPPPTSLLEGTRKDCESCSLLRIAKCLLLPLTLSNNPEERGHI